METVDVLLRVAYMWALGAVGILSIAVLVVDAKARIKEINRDARWKVMMHERIWQDEDEPRG